MTLYDTLTSTPVLLAAALGLVLVLIYRTQTLAQEKASLANANNKAHADTHAQPQSATHAANPPSGPGKSKMPSVMSAPAAELAPPKSDPIPTATLAQHNGSDPSKPIYVAIKGNVYDVSAKRDMYGPGQGYNVFAGRDASKGLGMSSLDLKDAVPDYSGLDEKQMKTLDHWESFFQKRYNIVGKVVP